MFDCIMHALSDIHLSTATTVANQRHCSYSLLINKYSFLFRVTVNVKFKFLFNLIQCKEVMGLYYWQGNGLVIHRSQVRVLAGHHYIMPRPDSQ